MSTMLWYARGSTRLGSMFMQQPRSIAQSSFFCGKRSLIVSSMLERPHRYFLEKRRPPLGNGAFSSMLLSRSFAVSTTVEVALAVAPLVVAPTVTVGGLWVAYKLLVDKIDSCKSELISKIDKVDSKVDCCKSELISKIDKVDSKVDSCKSELISKIDSCKSELGSKIDSKVDFKLLVNTIDSKVDSCKIDVGNLNKILDMAVRMKAVEEHLEADQERQRASSQPHS